jgi:hypothetical protein
MDEELKLEIKETKKQRAIREAEEWRLERWQEERKRLALDKEKRRIKWLTKIIAQEEDYSLEDYLREGFDDNYTGEDFLRDLIEIDGVKKNALIKLMDKKGFFDCIDEAISEMEADAHDEWWYGEARDQGFWPRNG